MPGKSEEGNQVLKAKVYTEGCKQAKVPPVVHYLMGQDVCWNQAALLQGQPYCAAGVVDLLALFRCVSCRYCFSTDLTKPELLGAPGRVFTSRQVCIELLVCCFLFIPDQLAFLHSQLTSCLLCSWK